MAGFDYVILAILLLSAVVGLVRGFLREVCSLITLVLAVWLAWKLGPSLEPFMGGALRQANYGLWVGRMIVFVLVIIGGGIVGALVAHFVRLSLFTGTDRFLGFLLGLARGVVVLGAVVLLGRMVHLDGEDWWKASILAPQLGPVAGALQAITGETLESLDKAG
jgi:membrane protein required for colicin V production